MSIEYTTVDPATRQAFYDTLLTFWDQKWEGEFQHEFLAWRYGRRTDGETLVAMAGSKCIGLLDDFIRPYRVGGREVLSSGNPAIGIACPTIAASAYAS
jgi:hypothetical protein